MSGKVEDFPTYLTRKAQVKSDPDTASLLEYSQSVRPPSLGTHPQRSDTDYHSSGDSIGPPSGQAERKLLPSNPTLL